VTRRRDLLVLFVSEAETDFSLLCQKGVGTPSQPLSVPRAGESLGMLDSLFYRMGHRDFEDARLRPSVAHEWAVQKQALVAERLTPECDMEIRSAVLELSMGVRLVNHLFSSHVRLMSTASAAHRIGPLFAPPRFFSTPTRTLALTGRLASDGGLSVLELRGGDPNRITPDDPPRMEADNPDLQPGEAALILAFNGEDWWLVGRDVAADDARGTRWFEISGLPTAADRLWLFFQAAREADVAETWTGSIRKLSGAA
jgi:hypothetical protein